MEKDLACKTSRWMALKAQLNNLKPLDFKLAFESDKDAILLDVRTLGEFETGHMEGAEHIDYFAVDFWDKIEQLNPQKNIYVYCRSGRRSIRTCTLMRNGGFDNVKLFNLDGGWNEWVKHT